LCAPISTYCCAPWPRIMKTRFQAAIPILFLVCALHSNAHTRSVPEAREQPKTGAKKAFGDRKVVYDLDQLDEVQRVTSQRITHGVARSGVEPYLSGLLDDSRAFLCTDKLSKVPLDHVNDNFCDCEDGSDEPGTAACPTMRFYCRNRGHLGKYIFSSRVIDGICDCCDGSDEQDVTGKSLSHCKNTCAQAAEIYWKEHSEEMKKYEEGAKLKQALVASAKEKVKRLFEEQQDLAARLAEDQDTLSDARRHLSEVRRKEDAGVAQRHMEARALLAQRLGFAHLSETERLTLLFRLGAISDEYADRIVAVATEIRAPPTMPAEAADGEATEVDEDEDEDMAAVQTDAAETAKQESGAGVAVPIVEPLGEDAVDVEEEEEAEGSGLATEVADLLATLGDKFVPAAVTAAESGEKEAKRSVDKLQGDLDQNRQTLDSTDFGPDFEWLALKDQCVSKHEGEFEYKVCIGTNAMQGSTSLGKFKGWAEGGYKTMLYEDGTRCWNGPARSIKVHVSCGTSNKILTVDEPNMCTYVAKMESPAACDLRHVQSLQFDLENAREAHANHVEL